MKKLWWLGRIEAFSIFRIPYIRFFIPQWVAIGPGYLNCFSAIASPFIMLLLIIPQTLKFLVRLPEMSRELILRAMACIIGKSKRFSAKLDRSDWQILHINKVGMCIVSDSLCSVVTDHASLLGMLLLRASLILARIATFFNFSGKELPEVGVVDEV